MYTCPVCFYNGLEESPVALSYEICPSCGTEFAVDDSEKSWKELRQDWKDKGCVWWSKYEKPKEAHI